MNDATTRIIMSASLSGWIHPKTIQKFVESDEKTRNIYLKKLFGMDCEYKYDPENGTISRGLTDEEFKELLDSGHLFVEGRGTREELDWLKSTVTTVILRRSKFGEWGLVGIGQQLTTINLMGRK